MKPRPGRLPHRGAILNFIIPLTRYFVTHAFIIFGWILFRIFNITVPLRRKNIGEEMNTVLLSNHQAMIDGFLVGAFAYFPRSLVKPVLFPWIPAAYENFFGNPIMAFLSDNWKCIPVKPGRKDFGAMKRMAECLKDGTMIVFPEGTRSRDGRILPPRSGIGYVMLQTHPRAIPVCMDGMDRTLPVGAFWPRVGNTIFLYFGKPVDLSEFYAQEPSRENAEAAIEKVFKSVRRQQKVLARYRRYRKHILPKRCFLYRFYKP